MRDGVTAFFDEWVKISFSKPRREYVMIAKDAAALAVQMERIDAPLSFSSLLESYSLRYVEKTRDAV